MGFIKDAAKFGAAAALSPIGLGASLLSKKKKPEVPKVPSMISTVRPDRPSSMIGSQRGGY